MAKKRANGEGTITKRADGRFMGQVSVKDPVTGKRTRISFYGKTQKEVMEKINKVKYEVQTGSYKGENDITVMEWFGAWLNEYKKNGLKKGTLTNYQLNIKNHITPNLGAVKIQDLRADHLQRLYNTLLTDGRKNGSSGKRRGLSPTTVMRIHIIIHSALKQAMKNGILNSNVAEAVNVPKQIKHEIHPLSRDEMQEFLSVAKEDRLYAAFLLECGTGLRRGELLGLKWGDLDFEKMTLTVRRSLVMHYDVDAVEEGRKCMTLEIETPKTEKSKRTISVPRNVIKELSSHRARQNEEKLMIGKYYNNEDLVFCKVDGTRYYPTTMTERFKRMLKKAGVKDVRFHDLRHSVATLLLEENVHPKVVQEVLGHSTITTTLDIYSHVSLEKKEEAAAKLDVIFK